MGGNRNLKVFGCATIVQAKQMKAKSQGVCMKKCKIHKDSALPRSLSLMWRGAVYNRSTVELKDGEKPFRIQETE